MTSRSKALPTFSLRTQLHMAVVSAALVAPVAGCWSSETSAPTASSASAFVQELVGGFAANSSRFNAVGSLTITAPDPFGGPPYPQQACTGTLIDQDTVLTARHCLDAILYTPDATLTFGLGPDASNPSATANVIAYQTPDAAYGGFSDMGHDLAVLQLDTPLTDAPTAALSLISGDDVGDRLATFGFGEQLSAFGGLGGSRQVGAVTVRAISGKIYELLFGDFATFHEWYVGAPVPPECANVPPISFGEGVVVLPTDPQNLDCLDTAFARGTYESTLLEEFDEIYAGGVEGDAQPCYGDSGGPLVRADASGKLQVYGVVSGSVYTEQTQLCGNGAVYAGLSEELIDFVETAAAWKDSCEVDTPQGICDGTVARRCTTLAESPGHEELSFDCATVGTTCQTQKNGYVGCGEDDSSFSPPEIAGSNGLSGTDIFTNAFKPAGQGAPSP